MTNSAADAAWLPLPSGDHPPQLANLRDLGGLRLAGGGVTSAGVLYRGDAPYPGDASPDTVPAWPPSTVVDLRSPGEPAAWYQWPAGVTVHRVPLMRRAAVVTGTGRGAAASVPDLSDGLRGLYLRMLEAVPDRLASFVGIAANCASPVFVHCAAGKDRTGMAIAVLLLAAGVEPGDVVADYTISASNMGGVLARQQGARPRMHAEVSANPELLGSPAEAITAVIDRLAAWPGGLSAWLEAHGGSAADTARWRDRLAGADSRR